MVSFLGYLWIQGRAPATAGLYVATVKSLAKENGDPDPVGPKTRAALVGFRREGAERGRKQAAPLLWEDVDRIADAAVGSDALLRVSELVAVNVGDVEFKFKKDGSEIVSALLTIRKGKTDQEATGAVRYLSKKAARALRKWLEASGISEGTVFRSLRKNGRTGCRLGTSTIGEILRRRAWEAGIKKRGIRSHSLRVGAAQSLVAAGCTLPDLLSEGRWASPRVAVHYTKRETA